VLWIYCSILLYSRLFPSSFILHRFFPITLFRNPCHTVHFPIVLFWIAYSRDPSWVLARVIHNTSHSPPARTPLVTAPYPAHTCVLITLVFKLYTHPHILLLIVVGLLAMIEGGVGVTKKGVRCRYRDPASLATLRYRLSGMSCRFPRTFLALVEGKELAVFEEPYSK